MLALGTMKSNVKNREDEFCFVPRIAYVMEMMQLTMFPSATGSAGWLWHFPWLLHSSAGLGSGFHEPGNCMQQRSSSFPWQWMSSLAWTLKMAATEQILMVSCCDQHTTAAGGHQSSPHPEHGHWAGCWGCTQWDFWYLWGWRPYSLHRCSTALTKVFLMFEFPVLHFGSSVSARNCWFF